MSLIWFTILIGAVMTVLFFLIGRHYANITADRLPERMKRDGVKLEHVHLYGRVMMYASPLIFLLFAAFAYGWLPGLHPDTVS